MRKEIQTMQVAAEQPKSEDQQCSICYTKSNRPVFCKGACHKIFCLKCAATAKTYSDRCPHRCSAPFEVELPPATQLFSAFCPYRPQDCTVKIMARQDLKKHYQVCTFISEFQRGQAEYKSTYKCKQGHGLTFLNKSSLFILHGKRASSIKNRCAECQQQEYCRTICIVCSLGANHQYYCSGCRPHPCSRSFCPLGHKLKHRTKPSKLRYCDFCDVPAGLLGKKVHGFCPCDFDICDLCYEKLPEKQEKMTFRVNPQQIWQLTMLNDGDSEDSEWQQ